MSPESAAALGVVPAGPAPAQAAPRPLGGGRPGGWPRYEVALAVALAAAVPLAYVALTDNVWEDYFITFRHSRNLARGQGLVYNPGERVHGFTSPLGTLLPALFDWLLGSPPSYEPALNCFRALSIVAFAGGAALALLALRAAGCPPAGRLVFVLLYAAEAKSVAFTGNGMETGLVLLFLAWSFHALVGGYDRRWRSAGASWAALLWARPDGAVYVAALACCALAFPGRPRRGLLVGLLKAAGLCAAIYLPWLLGAWLYYGSPVPQTVVAKLGGAQRDEAPIRWAEFLYGRLTQFLPAYLNACAGAFRPIYAPQLDDWPRWQANAARALAAFAALYWALPTWDRAGRAASLAFALLGVYLACQPMTFPWYYPPAALFGALALAAGFVTLGGRAARARPAAGLVAAGLCVAAVAHGAWLLQATTRLMAFQQREIEFNHRMKVGQWLAGQVRPGETVYTECFGYVGYFSGAHVDDFPGLVSPRVTRLRREKAARFHTLVAELRPEWVVARPWEADLFLAHPEVRENYRLVNTFDAYPRLRQYGQEGGRKYLLFDIRFQVFRRVEGRGGGDRARGP